MDTHTFLSLSLSTFTYGKHIINKVDKMRTGARGGNRRGTAREAY